jgi:hypothetical protein
LQGKHVGRKDQHPGGYKDFYLQFAAAARLQYRLIEAAPPNRLRRSRLRPLENEDLIVDLPAIEEFLATL